jgi:hypothetical protein
VVLVVSGLTSVAFLVGFVSMTVIAWRRDTREAKHAELETQLREIEIEKARLEVAKLRSEGRRDRIDAEVLEPAPGDTAPEQDRLTALRQILVTRFDIEDFRTLCFDLPGVNYDDLPGEGRANKARELVRYLALRGRIPVLIEIGRRLRPDISWPAMAEEKDV